MQEDNTSLPFLIAKLSKQAEEQKQTRCFIKQQAHRVRQDSNLQGKKILHLEKIIDNLKEQLELKNKEVVVLRQNVTLLQDSEFNKALEVQITDKEKEIHSLENQLREKEREVAEAKQKHLEIAEKYVQTMEQLTEKTAAVKQLEMEVEKLKFHLETEIEMKHTEKKGLEVSLISMTLCE